jgi:type IV secretion system protein TrbD
MNFRQRKWTKPSFVYPFLRSSPTPRLQLLNLPKPVPLNCPLDLTAPGGRKLRGRRWGRFLSNQKRFAQRAHAAYDDGAGDIAGFEAPVHRSRTEPILLAGAPRAVAILNGTVSAALRLGLRLWIAGSCSGRSATWPLWAAKRDPFFAEVVRRHVASRFLR